MTSRSAASENLANRIDLICDRFEQAWDEGRQPQAEAYLKEVSGKEQAALLRELLATELEIRRADEEVDPETYIARFPDFRDVVVEAFSGNRESTINDATSLWFEGVLGGARVAARHSRGLLSAVPADVLDANLVERRFPKGQALMRQGDPGTALMVVCNGTVEIQTEDTAGKTHVIDHSSKGDVLGEMSLLTGQPCTANVVALEDVRVLSMSIEVFHQLARQYPELSVIMTNLVADRLGRPGRDALADKTLDRYRVKRRLGRGGMGVVYEAVDTVNDERVALKMMSHRLVYDTVALQRFRQEANIIEAFEHPHIVKLIRRFAAFHTYFIAMEFFDGWTLQQLLLEDAPLSATAFQTVMGQLASALLYAHQAKVVHRDIKPANIMLDVNGDVKLMDFGLAEPVAGSQIPTGRPCGTPRYMAPEQRIGGAVGKEADFFGLGCVAYEMLTGKQLFEGDELFELTRDFTTWQPPRFNEIRPDVPREVCQAIQPSLEEDIHNRSLDLQLVSNWI